MPKRNKFCYFVDEIVFDLRRNGMKHATWHLVNEKAATEEWSRLSLEEKSPYEAMAKAGQFTYDPRLDFSRLRRLARVKGAIASAHERLGEEKLGRRAFLREMKTRLSSLPSGPALAQRRFFLVNFECFVRRPFVPCEFSLFEFSVVEGVVRTVHSFVDPVRLPPFLGLEEKSRSESVHRVPFLTRFASPDFDFLPPNNPLADADLLRLAYRDHGRLCRMIVAFLTDAGRRPLPTLFTLDRRRDGESGVEMASACYRWLADAADKDDEWLCEWERLEVLPLEELLLTLLERATLPRMEPAPDPAATLTDLKWEYSPKTRCWFHDVKEAACTSDACYRWCYATFDWLKNPTPLYDFELTASHVPATPLAIDDLRIFPSDVPESPEEEADATLDSLVVNESSSPSTSLHRDLVPFSIPSANSSDFSDFSFDDELRVSTGRRTGFGRGTRFKPRIA